jgi:hypothetical protein
MTIEIEFTGGELNTKARIVLEDWSEDEDGRVALSPDCISYDEVETWADQRIKELKKVKKEAKRKLD